MTARRRVDAELVRRGLAESRNHAQALVDHGVVRVGGAPVEKVTRLVLPSEALEVIGPGPRFVSRGGEKLDAALDYFGIDVTGWRVLDVGASTGGFTDCLRQRGAVSVVALDVGRNQLHERLRADPAIDDRQQTDVRAVSVADLGGAFDFVTVDVSFISLRSVASALVSLAGREGILVVLVKPQFEVGKAEVSRGKGVIRDAGLWREALDVAVSAFATAGAATMAVMESPLRGARGNVEFLIRVQVGATSPTNLEEQVEALLAASTPASRA